jgi:hypothetical protein
MALIGNFSIYNKLCGWNRPGTVATGTATDQGQSPSNKPSARWGRYYGGFSQTAAHPRGYLHPLAIIMPIKPGEMSAVIDGVSTFDGSGSAGINMEATLTGSGDVSTSAELVVSAAATLAGVGVISTADLRGIQNAAATLAGIGTISSAELTAKANIAATVTSTGDLTATLNATANIAATITTAETLSPTALAQAVWSAIASDNNDPLTMGEKMNGAGSAGDPWSTVLPGSYTSNQAGAIVNLIHKILRNKQVTDPATGKFTVYDDDGTSVLLEADLFEDAAGSLPYDGAGAERRDRLE